MKIDLRNIFDRFQDGSNIFPMLTVITWWSIWSRGPIHWIWMRDRLMSWVTWLFVENINRWRLATVGGQSLKVCLQTEDGGRGWNNKVQKKTFYERHKQNQIVWWMVGWWCLMHLMDCSRQSNISPIKEAFEPWTTDTRWRELQNQETFN